MSRLDLAILWASMVEVRMGQRLLVALLAILALLSPSWAFEIKEGECERILSGQARVRIHYSSGLKAEFEPVDLNNVTSQVDVFTDGRKSAHKWIGGGGLLPLENPRGQFAYADIQATKLLFEPGETRQLSFAYKSSEGRTTSGTMVVAVERVEKAAFGECQATFVTIAITTSWAHSHLSARIVRLFVKELGFFIASTVEQVKEGKPELVNFKATRIELIR